MAADKPLAQQGDAGLDLLGRGLGNLGAAAARTQARVNGRVGLAGAARPRGDQVLKLLALGGTQLVGGDSGVFFTHLLRGAGLLLRGNLVSLASAQQGRHLVGVQQARNTQVFLLFLGAYFGAGTPCSTVEEDPVELGVRAQDLGTAYTVSEKRIAKAQREALEQVKR